MTDYRVCTQCGLTVFAVQTSCPSCGASTEPEADPHLIEEWHEKAQGLCVDCGQITRVRRLLKAKGYNAKTRTPEFRCYECSMKKLVDLRERGIPV